MDHVRCLEVQRPYLGRVECHYTDWTPLQNRINSFAEDRRRPGPLAVHQLPGRLRARREAFRPSAFASSSGDGGILTPKPPEDRAPRGG
jgi:hypothetical protein